MKRFHFFPLLLVCAGCRGGHTTYRPVESDRHASPLRLHEQSSGTPRMTRGHVPSTAPAKIAEFQGQYRFLSNFWPATVEFEGIVYPSVEHAYQSAKTLDMDARRRMAELPTPAEAKSVGRALKLRDDWETAKFVVMEECVRYKFTHHADLREKLLATGDAPLEEGNTWGDRIWGVYQGQGENRLGKILMKVREELQHAD